MYIVSNRVPVKDEWENEFEKRFRQRAGKIEKQHGFLRMLILRPDKENTPYVVTTIWQSKAAFESWIQSEDFMLAHRNPMPEEAFYGKSIIERHEVAVIAEKEHMAVA